GMGLILGAMPRLATIAWLDRAFVWPLSYTGVLATGLALFPLLACIEWEWLIPLASCTLWLGILWLALAGKSRDAGFFTAFQVAVLAAVLLGVTDWLGGQDWVDRALDRLIALHGLQVYGLALAALSVGWMVVRRLTRHESR